MSSSTAPLVSYHTSCIYNSDVRLLSPGCWLNDAIMTFVWDWEQYHEHGKHASRIRFISAGPTFILLHEEDEDDLCDTLSGCDINKETELVLWCCNDNPHKTGAGGSHWSLLVYVMSTHTWHYYDSAGHSNTHVALCIAEKMTPYMHLHQDEKQQIKWNTKMFIQEQCPQQSNGYDCGVYTCALAHHIAASWLETPSISHITSTLKKIITPQYITKYRDVIHDAIKRAQKGEE